MNEHSRNWDQATLLAGLSQDARGVMAARWTEEKKVAGQLIFGDKDPSRDLFFVLEGSVRAAAFTLNGREVSFNEIHAGDCFGEIAAIDGGVRSSSVVALGDVVLARLTAVDFQQILSSTPEISRAFLILLCGKTRAMSDKLVEYTELTAPQRVRRELLRRARLSRTSADAALITDLPPQGEIATNIFARREAVAREMARLNREGIVLRGEDGFTVPSIRRLEAEVLL